MMLVSQKRRQVGTASSRLGVLAWQSHPQPQVVADSTGVIEIVNAAADTLLRMLRIPLPVSGAVGSPLTVLPGLADQKVISPESSDCVVTVEGHTIDIKVTRLVDTDVSSSGLLVCLTDTTMAGKDTAERADLRAMVAAIDKSQAAIQFNMDGTIITANNNFLGAVGYTLGEIQGQHHRMFVDPAEAASAAYTNFWASLRRGEYQVAEFRRIHKSGADVWIQASYNPVFDENGVPFKVVKYATDITKQHAERMRVTDGVEELLPAVRAVAAGDLTCQISLEGDDPIGKMAQALRDLVSSLRATIAPIAEKERALSAAAAELSQIAQQIAVAAEETSSQAGVVSAASEQVSANITSVAAATEQMEAAIQEVARSAANAASVATVAVDKSAEAGNTIDALGHSSDEIGGIVKVITSVADQTNLLALNATIEGARAGEAGKGFMVVANEVKDLAKETATATDDIVKKIESVKANTTAATTSIKAIAETIDQISELQSTIASAVEEQAATTRQITTSISETSQGSVSIAENISSVAAAASETARGATQTQQAASDLAVIADELHTLLSAFSY